MKFKVNKKSFFSFIPFVGLAMLFWVSAIMTKKSTYSKDIWVECVAPDSLIIMDSSLYISNVTLTGKGLDLIFVKGHSESNPLKVYINQDNNSITKEKIANNLRKEIANSNIDIINVNFPAVYVKMDKKLSKRIDIKFDGKISLKKLFGLKSKIKFEPEKVKISGPKSLIQNIKEWKTIPRSYIELENDIAEEIPLAKPDNKRIKLDKSDVEIYINVEELTEKKLILPIRIEGLKSVNVDIIPSEIEISFLVGLSKYESIDSTDFAATIYLNDDIKENTNYPVSIIKKPSDVDIQYIQPNYVDIYIKE